MLRRVLAGAAVAALLLTGCGAQQSAPDEVSIGGVTIVSHPSLDLIWEGVKEGLAEAGYVEGENLTLEFQNPQGDQATLTNIANTYAASKHDLFVAIATPPAQAMAQVIQDRPIVFASVTDPVAAGLVDSMEKPGGNVTGTSDQLPTDQQLKLILDIDPTVESVGIVYSASEVNAQVQAEKAMEAGRELGVEVKTVTIQNSSEVQQAAESLDVDAYFTLVDNTVVSAMESMVQVAEQKQSLLVSSDPDSVERGAAAALSTDYKAQGLQTAKMIVELLKGGEPGDTSVQLQESLETVVNPAAAERMGVTIPKAVIDEAATTY
ncbi:ABC transporter substrate-binding protein [Tessaracoccus sp. MC1865]|uniref:ABC transporter substrate-binding protein n=1 Tax=Tessaracoccus sp. MC1865 TaxID=2760310 RepID=UPI0015FF0B5E|nr:ABC transporter substrate-binding protein [Tessaracoccus sp. MC1865]MBB1483715.1 ABC transporter substrate-binding protein [Tessaracoccus sp. MC1865]QTO36784.1 ABC transporter substrate-binding protein [Tessaracoccus sp. MC1865]